MTPWYSCIIIPLKSGHSLRSLPNQLLQPIRASPLGLGCVKTHLCKLAFYAQSNRMVIPERQTIYISNNTKAASKCCMLYAAIISLNNSIHPSQITEIDHLKKAVLVAGQRIKKKKKKRVTHAIPSPSGMHLPMYICAHTHTHTHIYIPGDPQGVHLGDAMTTRARWSPDR